MTKTRYNPIFLARGITMFTITSKTTTNSVCYFCDTCAQGIPVARPGVERFQ